MNGLVVGVRGHGDDAVDGVDFGALDPIDADQIHDPALRVRLQK